MIAEGWQPLLLPKTVRHIDACLADGLTFALGIGISLVVDTYAGDQCMVTEKQLHTADALCQESHRGHGVLLGVLEGELVGFEVVVRGQ